MANPNLLAATTALGTTTYLTPSGTSAVVLLPNAAASNRVFKINHIRVVNIAGSASACAVNIYTNGSVAQGGTPAGGTAYPLFSGSVPASSNVAVVDKTTQIYLQEGTSITVSGPTASSTFIVSYEVIYV